MGSVSSTASNIASNIASTATNIVNTVDDHTKFWIAISFLIAVTALVLSVLAYIKPCSEICPKTSGSNFVPIIETITETSRPFSIPDFIKFENGKMIINGTLEVKNNNSSVTIGPDESNTIDVLFSPNKL